MDHLRGLIGGIGFLSTFPLGRDKKSFEAFRTHGYLFSILGFLLGGLIGLIGASFSFLPVFIAGAFYVTLVHLITGINHLDGLADFTDGLVVSGNQMEKLEAMKDSSIGVGGTLSIVLILLMEYSAVVNLFSLKLSYISLLLTFMGIEVFGKVGMLAMIAFGKSSHRGMGSIFMEKNSTPDFIIGVGLTAGITIPIGLPSLVTLMMSLGVVFIIIYIANRNLGGVSGDVMGAANEIVRVVGLIAMVMIYLYLI